MPSERAGQPEPLAVGVRDIGVGVVLAPRGTLSLRTVPQLRRALDEHLADRGRVLVDLSGLTLTWRPAIGVFGTALAATTGWPAARLVLFGDRSGLRAAGRLSESVHVADTEEQAVRLLDVRPRRLSRRTELACDVRAAKWARLLVDAVGEDWELTDVDLPAARLVASELVTDAVLRAGTSSVVTITLTDRALLISVRDFGRAERSDEREGAEPVARIVAALSRAWGVRWHDDGRSVWASIARAPG
jgi:anti-sigma regulatory factor (Ser/Thr protein kinase)